MNATGRLNGLEGDVEVPGATLRYRQSGPSGAAPWVVIENGWGASFPYACFLERALARHARVLCYDRAGIGESRAYGPASTEALTRHLSALLDHLAIAGPVVVVGHSYGGLIAALHAAQAPDRVRAIVQIDPTPERPAPSIDRFMTLLPALARLSRWSVQLGMRDWLFSMNAENMPPDVSRRLLRCSCALSSSAFDAALSELNLREDMHAAIGVAPAACPRLVLSATVTRPTRGRLMRWLGADAAAQRNLAITQDMHRRQAAHRSDSRWEGLPHDHGHLLSTPEGAAAVAARILAFL